MFLFEDIFKEVDGEEEVEISVTSNPDIDMSIDAHNEHDYEISRGDLDNEELQKFEFEALQIFWKPIADKLRENPLITEVDTEDDPEDGIGCLCKRKDAEEVMKFIKEVFDKFRAEKYSIDFDDCEISYSYTAGSYFWYDTYEETASVDFEISISDYLDFYIY